MSIAKDLYNNYQPLFDFLLLQQIPQSSGAIVMPKGCTGLPIYCRVLRIGPGRESDIQPGKYMEMPCKEGDLIVINGDQEPYLQHDDFRGDDKVGTITIVRATSMFVMGKVDTLPPGCVEISNQPSSLLAVE